MTNHTSLGIKRREVFLFNVIIKCTDLNIIMASFPH